MLLDKVYVRVGFALTTTPETKNEVQGRLFLDVIIRECTSILELFTSENESLLIRWNTLLVLDLSLDVIDRVRRLNLQSNRLPGECLYENLHTINRLDSFLKVLRKCECTNSTTEYVYEKLTRKSVGSHPKWVVTRDVPNQKGQECLVVHSN